VSHPSVLVCVCPLVLQASGSGFGQLLLSPPVISKGKCALDYNALALVQFRYPIKLQLSFGPATSPFLFIYFLFIYWDAMYNKYTVLWIFYCSWLSAIS